MSLDAIKARLGALGPRALENLTPSVRRLVLDDLPLLIQLAHSAQRFSKNVPFGMGAMTDKAHNSLEQCITALGMKKTYDEMLPAAARAGS